MFIVTIQRMRRGVYPEQKQIPRGVCPEPLRFAQGRSQADGERARNDGQEPAVSEANGLGMTAKGLSMTGAPEENKHGHGNDEPRARADGLAA